MCPPLTIKSEYYNTKKFCQCFIFLSLLLKWEYSDNIKTPFWYMVNLMQIYCHFQHYHPQWNETYNITQFYLFLLSFSLSCRKSLNIASSCLVSPSCVLFVTGCMAIQFFYIFIVNCGIRNVLQYNYID